MDVEKVLSAFERVADLTAEAREFNLHKKLFLTLEVYPFPALTRAQAWRRDAIRHRILGHMEALIQPPPPPHPSPAEQP